MQQSALNLIAIGVFTMTLACLVGPLLNISPFIPAAATATIMGLATIDTLGWENRGTTLLLDALSSPQQRQRVIHHEAGHFLAAYFLGIPVTGYTLTAWEAWRQEQPGRGGVTFDTEALTTKPFSLEQMRLTLERFCTVWMAGIAAEKIIYGNVEGGAEDREKLRTALNLAGLPEKVYAQKERWAQLQATTLIEKYQKSYEALVAAMEARASVEECYQVIQQHCPQEG
jgi:hypothetical protein